jgi:hypothetical protein
MRSRPRLIPASYRAPRKSVRGADVLLAGHDEAGWGAIAIVVAGRKLLKVGSANMGVRRGHGGDRGSIRGYRRGKERVALVSTREAAPEAT